MISKTDSFLFPLRIPFKRMLNFQFLACYTFVFYIIHKWDNTVLCVRLYTRSIFGFVGDDVETSSAVKPSLCFLSSVEGSISIGFGLLRMPATAN